MSPALPEISEGAWLSEWSQSMRAKIAAMRTGLTKEQARLDPVDYLRFTVQDENGDPLVADHVTRLYVDVFEHCRMHGQHLSVVTPPGFGKTTLALGMMTRAIGRNPKLRTVVVTADLSDSINAVTLARQIVLTHQFKDVFPAAKPDVLKSSDARGWRQTHWYMVAAGMRKDPTMAAVAMKPQRESMRVDVGLFDDMVTEATCEGIKHAEVVRRFWNTWIEGRCRPRGWALYQQNVRRLNDLAHQLREDDRFCSMWIGLNEDCESLFVHVWNPPPGFPLRVNPAKYDAQQEPAPTSFPAPHLRFNMPLPNRQGWEPETLRAIHMSARKQLYHMQAVRSEDLMLPDWGARLIFNGTAAEMVGLKVDDRGLPVMTHIDRLRFGIVGGLDFSSTKRPGTCLWVLLVNADGHVFPLFLTKGNYTLADLKDILDMLWDNGIHMQTLNVEDVGVQDMLLKSLIRPDNKTAAPPWSSALQGFTTDHKAKWNPELGMPSINNDFAKGIIHWPGQESKAPHAWARDWKTFETVAETLTREGMKDKPPDEMMALLFARGAARIYGPNTGKVKASTVRARRPDPVMKEQQDERNPFKPGGKRKRGPNF